MITVSRRRLVLGAACAALVVVPTVAGWSTGRALRPSAAPSVSAAPDPAVLMPSVDPALSPSPASTEATLPAGMGAPVGWKLSDVPRFPPAPPPEPITLPPGDEAPFLSRIPVTQPVAFLTIDDGFLKNPEAVKLFAAAGIPVTLFLTTDAIQDDVPFFNRLRDYGAVIEAHTISHPELAGRGYDFQRRQICDGADRLGQWYGRRPVLFRPPFGDKDHTTLRIAKECGLRAVFMWKETVDKGIVRYQEQLKRVQPGDIILMHFRPAFVQDFLAALRAIHRAGLTPALLEDYVPGAGSPAPSVHFPPAHVRDLG
ncbi:polysaccharide deacetylase family protein [Actinoplanes sp. KI2]|uniref:polysaccharide deacetylase family protein n=1 Tax=Actinoplanes sp. KI2 TaxID=2983315 RepID=UPI0021D57107|nr:polysaccharide deacetylase family protein [Actinoplanes sp. KI2]MCU7727023.1 polysaccharide deacetylase family protein [Actinoplanes sp. KI2]